MTAWVAATISYPLLGMFERDINALPLIAVAAIILTALALFLRATTVERAVAVLATVLVVSIIYACVVISPGELNAKSTQFLFVITIFGIGLGWALSDYAIISRLPVALISISAVALFLLLTQADEYQAQRLTISDNNPIWAARVIGLGGVGALVLLAFHPSRWLFCAAFVAICAVGIILTGSRGPLAGLILAAAVGFTILPLPRRFTAIVVLTWVGAIAWILIEMFDLLNPTRGLTFSIDDSTTALRIATYKATIDLISTNPSGLGIGEFRHNFMTYPHNIFLEFLVEWGWLAGGFLISWLVISAIGLFQMDKRADIIKLLFAYEIANASLSGDVTSPRFLYALAFVGTASLIARAIHTQWSGSRARHDLGVWRQRG